MERFDIASRVIRVRRLPKLIRVAILLALCGAVATLWWLLPPIAQDPDFHDFADKRPILGIANFWNVATNVAFALVALYGARVIARARASGLLGNRIGHWSYLAFVVSVGLIALGSGYYHWTVDQTYSASNAVQVATHNGALIWDRLAMTIAFASIPAIFVADRVGTRTGNVVLLPALLVLGILSMVDFANTGDLRLYRAVQSLSIVMTLGACLMFAGSATSTRFAVLAVVLFGLATLCESLDQTIYAVFDGAISGHSIKHLIAALACAVIPFMLNRAVKQQRAADI